jgi:hypothetical protein
LDELIGFPWNVHEEKWEQKVLQCFAIVFERNIWAFAMYRDHVEGKMRRWHSWVDCQLRNTYGKTHFAALDELVVLFGTRRRLRGKSCVITTGRFSQVVRPFQCSKHISRKSKTLSAGSFINVNTNNAVTAVDNCLRSPDIDSRHWMRWDFHEKQVVFRMKILSAMMTFTCA